LGGGGMTGVQRAFQNRQEGGARTQCMAATGRVASWYFLLFCHQIYVQNHYFNSILISKIKIGVCFSGVEHRRAARFLAIPLLIFSHLLCKTNFILVLHKQNN